MKSTPGVSKHTKRLWVRLLVFVLTWVVVAVVVHLPFVLLLPDLAAERGTDGEFTRDWVAITVQQLALTVSSLLTVYLVAYSYEGKKSADLRLTFNVKQLCFWFLVGTLFMIALALTMQLTGIINLSVRGWPSKWILLIFCVHFLVSVNEEVLFRGYLLSTLSEKMNLSLSVVISSLVFSALHAFNPHFSWIAFLNLTLFGVMSSLILFRTSTISASKGLHWSWNVVQGSVLGFNVSGFSNGGIFQPPR